MADKQPKKRKWLSTQALKEFINDITEEELQAEELYNESQQVFDTAELMETPIPQPKDSVEDQEDMAEQEAPEAVRCSDESEAEVSAAEAPSAELERLKEELASFKKEAEAQVQELAVENAALKEKLTVERTIIEDALKDRDDHWQTKVDEVTEEKERVNDQFTKQQAELTSLIEEKETQAAVKEELTATIQQLTELEVTYQEAVTAREQLQAEAEAQQQEHAEALAAVTQSSDEALHEQQHQFQQLKQEYEELEKDYQQLHAINQKNEAKLKELQSENDTLIEWLEEKDKELAATPKQEELGQLKKEIQQYQTAITRLEQKIKETRIMEDRVTTTSDTAQKLLLEETQMDAGEQGQVQENVQATEEMTESVEQLAAEKEALNSALFDAHEEIAKLEEKTAALEELEVEKDRLANRLADAQTELSRLKEQKASEESLELIQAKRHVDELTEQNEQLKQEVIQSQQEIGEVLISAKKQANRTVEEAQIEAQHMISSAELELENISNRAKKILIEVAESRKSVLSIYDDLEFKVEALSNGSLLNEIKKERQNKKMTTYFDSMRG